MVSSFLLWVPNGSLHFVLMASLYLQSVSLCSSSLRMSMRSPGSAQLALDGVGTMVNCTVKSEGKKEPCHEAIQASAATAEPQPGDPARASQDGADPQAPAQVPGPFPGAPGSVRPLCLHNPHLMGLTLPL